MQNRNNFNSIDMSIQNKNRYDMYNSNDSNDDIYNNDHSNEFDNKTDKIFDNKSDEMLKRDYNAALNAHNYLNNTNINGENLKKDFKNGDEKKKKTLRNCKELQWRLVASKEGIKMRESLLRESSQKNLPQMSRAQGISM